MRKKSELTEDERWERMLETLVSLEERVAACAAEVRAINSALEPLS